MQIFVTKTPPAAPPSPTPQQLFWAIFVKAQLQPKLV